jgi:hypothetical protein
MITVLRAGLNMGYTGYDHMISGNECDDVVGRSFRSVTEARRAAERAVERNADRRVRTAPIWLEVRFRSGEIREYTT